MNIIRATASNGYSTLTAEIPVYSPEIKEGYWADQNGKKITEARLDDTVYFIIKTFDIHDGKNLDLKLYDRDHFLGVDFLNPDEDEFAGKEIKKCVKVSGDTAILELQLPESWTQDVKKGLGKLELYWEVKYGDRLTVELPAGIDDYLDVRYSDNMLYMNPSPDNNDYPEVYATTGEMLMAVKVDIGDAAKIDDYPEAYATTGEILAVVRAGVDDAITDQPVQKAISRYALVKLEKGYLATNTGKVYGPTTAKGTPRKTVRKIISTNSGTVQPVNRGIDFTYTGSDGRLVTTRGVNQIEALSKQNKVLGAIKHTGTVMDIFALTKFLKNPKEGYLPVPVLGDITGMEVTRLYEEMEADFDESTREELDGEKSKGLEAINRYINQQQGANEKRSRYFIANITSEIASQIINGDFKTIDDIVKRADSASVREEDKNVHMLYRRTKHPVTEKEIAIIETFFIDIEE